jgi:signal transduction histidine kinase
MTPQHPSNQNVPLVPPLCAKGESVVDDTALRLPTAKPRPGDHLPQVPGDYSRLDKPAYPTPERCPPDAGQSGETGAPELLWAHALQCVATPTLMELGIAAAAVCTVEGRVLELTGTPRAMHWMMDHGLRPGIRLHEDTAQTPQLGRALRAACGTALDETGSPRTGSGAFGRSPGQTASSVVHAAEVPWMAAAMFLDEEPSIAPPALLCLWTLPADVRPLRATLKALAAGMRHWVRAEHERDERVRVDDRIRDIERFSILSSLAAGIAHEIRNPLTTARGFLQLFAERLGSDTDKQFLTLTIQELDRIHQLVVDFMSLARPAESTYQPVNVAEVLRSTAEFIRPEALLRDVVLETVIPAGEVWVIGDERQLKQVLLNIAQNALQACTSGGRVTLSLEASVYEVQLIVRDMGCGIPPHELDKVFQPFYTTKPTGTGLGLAISKRIVEEHRGSIEIDSTVGVGTTVTIRLPCSAAPPPLP